MKEKYHNDVALLDAIEIIIDEDIYAPERGRIPITADNIIHQDLVTELCTMVSDSRLLEPLRFKYRNTPYHFHPKSRSTHG